MSDGEFADEMVRGAQDAIDNGDACQVVVSRAFYNRLTIGSPLDIFRRMLDIPGSEQVSMFSYEYQ